LPVGIRRIGGESWPGLQVLRGPFPGDVRTATQPSAPEASPLEGLDSVE